jgi:hypothetical protein
MVNTMPKSKVQKKKIFNYPLTFVKGYGSAYPTLLVIQSTK